MTLGTALELPPELTLAIIGAGPAGIGVARVLRDLAVPGVAILERKDIDSSFKLWPSGMSLITPRFRAMLLALPRPPRELGRRGRRS